MLFRFPQNKIKIPFTSSNMFMNIPEDLQLWRLAAHILPYPVPDHQLISHVKNSLPQETPQIGEVNFAAHILPYPVPGHQFISHVN